MDRLPGLSWYDGCTWDYRMINILWQEFIRRSGTCRQPNNALYGAKGFSQLCGAQWSRRSSIVVASPLVHRRIHLSCLSRRIWRQGPCIKGYGDVTVDVVILIGCEPTHIISSLNHGIQWRVGAYSIKQWFAGEHGGAWKCVAVHWFTSWSRGRDSHHIGFVSGVTNALVHMGHPQGNPVVYKDKSQCTMACRRVRAYLVVCSGIWCGVTGSSSIASKETYGQGH